MYNELRDKESTDILRENHNWENIETITKPGVLINKMITIMNKIKLLLGFLFVSSIYFIYFISCNLLLSMLL